MIRKAPRHLSTLGRLASAARRDPQSSHLISADARLIAGPSHAVLVRHNGSEAAKSIIRKYLSPKGKGKAVEFSQRPKKKFAKHDDEDVEKTVKLLRPAILSSRVHTLCSEGKLDEAVDMVKAMPLGSQNTIVWNLLMKQAFMQGRLKLAYALYVDMKRRGMVPTVRTYNTLFAGYGHVGDWSPHTKQLEHVDGLWERFMSLAEDVIKTGSKADIAALNPPIQWYFRILGDSGQYQKLFDVYNALIEGPLLPNQFAYSSFLAALAKRTQLPSLSDEQREAAQAQNASDCRLIWRQMRNVAERNPQFIFDSHILTISIGLLGWGSPSDHLFAFDLVREFFGLAKPGEDTPPSKLPLSSQSLAELLWLCNMSRKYRLTIHYFSQVVDRIADKKEEPIIDRKHIQYVLAAYAGLSAVGSVNESTQALSTLQWMLREDALRRDDAMRPTVYTFTQALIVCWRGNDWASTLRTFELMSGYHADDFMSTVDITKPRMDERSEGRNILPDTRAMSYFARTALATQDVETMKQCLRIMEVVGGRKLLPSEEEEGKQAAAHRSRTAAFYDATLADATSDLVKAVLKDSKQNDISLTDEQQRWMALRTRAKNVLAAKGDALKLQPEVEQQPLGSARGLAATASVVENEFARRHLRTTKQ